MFTDGDGVPFGALVLAGDHAVGGEETSVSYTPGGTGTVLYLSVEDVAGTLAAAEEAGGEVLVDAEALDGGGTFGIVADTEGNRVGVMRFPSPEEGA
jgi:predicted enzyme related to lactoylglutathione lyase